MLCLICCFQLSLRTVVRPLVYGKLSIIDHFPLISHTTHLWDINLHSCGNFGYSSHFLSLQQFLSLIITKTMSKVGDITIDNIIKKYENRQQRLLSDICKEADSQDTARGRGEYIQSGASTPEFSHTINRREINKKFEDSEEQILRTQKKQDHARMRETQPMSFSTDRREIETLLRQLEQTEERLARSQRNYAEASRKCEQFQRQGREVQLQGRLRQHQTGELQGRLAALQRQNQNYKQCLAAKDSNIEILREKLKEKNEKLIDCQRITAELRSQLAAITAIGQKTKQQEENREREKEELISRLQNELAALQNMAGDREGERKGLLQEMERAYRAHQQEMEVVKQSYLLVEEQYRQWIDGCNAEKLNIIKEYEQKLTEVKAAAQNAPSLKTQNNFQQQLARRERQSTRLIALTAKQASDIKALRNDVQSAEKAKSQLIFKVSAIQNALLDKTQMLSSLDQAYTKLVQQNKQEEEKSRQLREKYHSVNRQFVELRSKCSVLFESLEETKRGTQSEGAELVRVRKELLQCREQLERSRNNEMVLGVKLADSTRAVKDRLSKLEQEREESLTELLAERLQNARLQEELQETRQHLKREYDLSLENTRKELERQINANSSRVKPGSDPEKERLYLQLRALQRKYELLANEIVTVDEVIDISNKVKRRHQPLKKSRLQA